MYTWSITLHLDVSSSSAEVGTSKISGSPYVRQFGKRGSISYLITYNVENGGPFSKS